jgi:hypothetical protein
VNPELGGDALPLDLIHPTSLKNSANFAYTEFSKVREVHLRLRIA